MPSRPARDGDPIVAEVTAVAVADLGLAPGGRVLASVMAVDVAMSEP